MIRLLGFVSSSCVLLIAFSVAIAAPMDLVITPVGVTGSADTATSFTGGAGELINLINGNTDGSMVNNGLIEDGTINPEVPVAVITEEDALMFQHRNIFTGEPALAQWHWVTAGRNGGDFSDFFDPNVDDSPITIDFDLDGTFNVSGLFVWRYNGGFGSLEQNNPKDWTIQFSIDGGTNFGNEEILPMLTNTGLGGQSVASELLSFPSHEANSVRITITDNFKGEPGLAFGGDRIGLAEVRFQGLPIAAPNADFDMDGDVDGRDFLIWQRGFGTGTTLAQGDANNSGTVDGSDLAIWQAQYGTGALSAAVAFVPEPSGVFMACLASFFTLVIRNHI